MVKNGLLFCFWPFMTIFHHLRLLMGNPLIQPLFLLTTLLSLGAVAMISAERKLLQAINAPFFRHLIENWIFGHIWPFVPIHGRPLDSNSAFINKVIITGCCCNDIYERNLLQAINTPFSLH